LPVSKSGHKSVSRRYRLYPTPEQEAQLLEHCAHARYVWNLAWNLYECGTLETYGEASRRTDKHGNEYIHQKRRPVRWLPGWVAQCRMLTEVRDEYEWMAAGSVIVQQAALRDFHQAMQKFYAGTHGRPHRRKRNKNEGFRVTGECGGRSARWDVRRLNRNAGEVQVPKIGWVRFKWSRDVPPDAKSYRVTMDCAGRWHVAFTAQPPALDRKPTGAIVGIDRGVRTALVTSDGQHYRAPRISGRRAARYLALQRKMARQQKGSAKREKTRLAMARITGGAAGRRKDWAEKISTRLVQDHDVIVFEKLNIRNMTRKPEPKPDPDKAGAFLPNRRHQKAGLTRGILTSCWGLLAMRAEQKAVASGALVVYVDPKHTSQECRRCGHVAKGNRESQASFLCVECGHEDHADANAAKNILARGLATLAVPAQAPGLWGVRPHQPARAAAGTTRSAA
jgi:putative transposase